MKIVYFLTDRHGPGNLRCLIPGEELKRQYGWKFSAHNTMSVVSNHVMIEADIYVMARQTHRALPIVIKDMVEEQGKCVIGETDDWFLGLSTVQKTTKHASEAYYTIQPRILGACSAMTVSTPELAEGYSRLNRNIRVIPNYLDWKQWEDVELVRTPQFRIGWMGGTGWHLRDLAVIRGVIGPWLQRHPDVLFVAAGDKLTHDLLEIPERQRVTFPTVPHDRLVEITATMDLGLVPLQASRFNDAKSALKGMEYGACGIPCIASPVREYREWVEPGVNGFLAERARDWIRHLDWCYDNQMQVRTMGIAAREKAKQNSIQNHVSEWHDFYMETFERTQRTDVKLDMTKYAFD